VTGIAPACTHRGVAHRICCETRSSIDVTITALKGGSRNVRRRRQAQRRRSIMTTRAIGIGGLVGIFAARPTGEV